MKFSFSKKAEPKRVVEALRTAPKADAGREEIVGLESGQVTVNEQKEAAKKLAITCKNPLNETKRMAPKPQGAVIKAPAFDESKGGLTANLAKLSAEDKEAVTELMKAVDKDGDDQGEAVMPILMRAGSKKARSSENAPEARKDQFENVPVESFGEAMLRGMGYDPGKHKTKPVFNSQQRDSCLGLGAKALLPHEKVLAPGAKKKAADAAAAAKAKASSANTAAGAPPATGEAEKRRRVGENGESVDSSSQPATSAANGRADGADDMWPTRGLVVRLVSKEARLKEFYGSIASVLEVDQSRKCCKIKARDKSDKTHVLQDVLEADLETRVSRDCKSVRVVRGSQTGIAAKLVKRDVERNVAVVRIEGVESELPLDCVCESMI